MKIDLVDIETLITDPNNARKHGDKNMATIRSSLKQFDVVEPLVVRRSNNVVIGGNGRLAALKEMGRKKVPVHYVDLDDQKAAALALALNRSAELAEWDDDALGQQLQALFEDGFDIGDIGFDPNDYKLEDTSERDEKEDDVPETQENEFKVERGDIWQLGEHRVMCGDSTDKANVEKLMNGKKADMVFTDPPYNMEAQGGSNQPIGRAAAKLGKAIAHLCEFDPSKFLETLPNAMALNKMNAYIFCNKDLVPDYLHWARERRFNFNILVWKKPSALPLGGQHRPDLEYLILVRKSAIWNNGLNGVNYSKLLVHDRENSTDHPTMKPVALIENQLLIGSISKSVIYEPFCGSGSTLIACEKTKRKCYGMEIDPHYCSVIIKRWQEYTGQVAAKP